MNNLSSTLQRLYFLDKQAWHSQQADTDDRPKQTTAGALTPTIVEKCLTGEIRIAFNPVASNATTRAMFIHFKKPGDWEQVGNLYQAVQLELDLPAPALSISGQKGFQLWFSLAAPVPLAQTRSFLNALRQKYLADIPSAALELLPAADQPTAVTLVPAFDTTSGKWSAFIDPSLGSMFITESGLEMAPNMDRQAAMLAGLKSIEVADFERVLHHLQTLTATPGASAQTSRQSTSQPGADTGQEPSMRDIGNNFNDPKSFLLAVMNAPSASTEQRIQAAKALLPYFSCVPSE
ncbi:MAG: hypothetical protein CVU16_12980 [Betaproteobacteria bacterium HGW-Betaproteobacteria-10]|nr:MAG: hypothetical protein CVU16_12980 [Betaproteobacteria bacterium HGW-Betaproteobacteria-10]